MKTNYLDTEIRHLEELESANELIPLEIEQLAEYKAIKEQLILSGVVKSFCECTDNPMKIEMTVSRCASCCEIVKD
jgi:hypothetical protein